MKLIYAPSARRIIPYPPVGIAVLYAALNTQTDMQVEVCDLEMKLWSRNRLRNDILLYEREIQFGELLTNEYPNDLQRYQQILMDAVTLKPGEILGISVMGYLQVSSALLLALGALQNGSPVVMGGQFWTEQNARDLLLKVKNPNLYIVVGDGCEALCSLVETMFQYIPINVYTFREGRVVFGGEKTYRSDPPLPDYSWVDWSLYSEYAEAIYKLPSTKRRAHIYVGDRSCPFKCSFCRVSSGSHVKTLRPEEIVTSIDNLVDNGITHFNILANELNPSCAYLRQFIAEMLSKAHKWTGIHWFTYLRPDLMSADDLRNLRTLGCRLVRFGVESGSQSLVDKMHKGYSIGIVEKVLRRSSEADILNHINIIVGHPGETEDDIHETLSFLTRNRDSIHSVRINPFYLAPGSPMAREPHKYNLRLFSFKSGYYDFETIDGDNISADTVKKRILAIGNHALSLDIGFLGVLPFLLLDILSCHASRDEAILYLKSFYPFLWENRPADEIKALLGGYPISTSWETTIYRRGRNYNVTLTDN